MKALFFELRHASRRLAKSPGFLMATVLMLSLGTGLTVLMFSAIQAYMLSQPPYPEPQELVYIQMEDPVSGRDEIEVPQPLYLRWKEQSLPGELAGFYLGTVNLSGEARRPERLEGAFVTTDAFEILREQPLMGRGFAPADAVPGASPVVVISHGLWLNRYLGAPDIIGRSIRVNARPATIFGVMPEGFAFPWLQDIWLPITRDPNVSYRDAVELDVIGRLSAGAGVGAMHDALAAALAHVEKRYAAVTPGYFDLFGIRLREGRTFDAGDDAGHPDVAVVTQAFVDEYLPEGDAVGGGIRMAGETEPVRIVGVTDNVIQDESDLNWPPRPVLYRREGVTSGPEIMERRSGI